MEKGEPEMFIWNTGTLTLTLYHGPVPPVATFLVMVRSFKCSTTKISQVEYAKDNANPNVGPNFAIAISFSFLLLAHFINCKNTPC